MVCHPSIALGIANCPILWDVYGCLAAKTAF